MENSVYPDETAHYWPSHLDLHCLQKYPSERGNNLKKKEKNKQCYDNKHRKKNHFEFLVNIFETKSQS